MKKKIQLWQCLALALLLILFPGCTPQPSPPVSVPTATATVPTDTPVAIPPTTVDQETQPVSEPVEVPKDWQSYQDTTYQFQIALPSDWESKTMDADGPGMPDDWPVKSVTVFYPSSMADQMNREGPPDPTAPPVVPPFSVEVCLGSEQDFRRAYPEAGISESTTINGLPVVIEREDRDDMNMIRYVYSKDTQRVVFVDAVSGFSERLAAFPEFPDLMAQIVHSFTYMGEGQPGESTGTETYRQIEVPELGLMYEMPTSWYQDVNGEKWFTDETPGAFIGVKWMDMDAPQEPEAVMLPRPSQIIFSGEYALEGNLGRMIGVETYAEAPSGDEQAPLETVETHMLVVLESDGQRRALDVYAGAESQTELESVIAVYQRLLGTLSLRTN